LPPPVVGELQRKAAEYHTRASLDLVRTDILNSCIKRYGRQKGHWKLNKEEKRTDNFEISEKELNKKVFQEIVVKKLQLSRDSKESRRKT